MPETTARAAAAAAAPLCESERIPTLDVLRGAALLGILLMNILAFGLPSAADGNPTVAGGASGLNLWAWILQFVLFDGKMRGIFSIMFGAGVYLFIARAERNGAPAADLHYRRSLWLLLFGIVHAYVIWYGDILFPYALLALVLYPLRELPVRTLLIAAGLQFVVMTAAMLGDAYMTDQLRETAAKADQAAARAEKLSAEQIDAQKEWKEKLKDMQPDKEALGKEIKAHQGTYLDARKFEAKEIFRGHSTPIYSPYLWDMLGMMLLGIALIRTGVLSGERSTGFYWLLMSAGYLTGLPIGAYSVWRTIAARFDPVETSFSFSTYELSRLGMTLGHVALLLLIARSARWTWITSKLAAVGKMAFSNYIATSILCTTIFYGFGFGLFARLERYQLYYVVVGVWAFNLIWSPLWLAHYRFGPLEWCWRSLTYWKRQPMLLPSVDVILEPHENSQQPENIPTL